MIDIGRIAGEQGSNRTARQQHTSLSIGQIGDSCPIGSRLVGGHLCIFNPNKRNNADEGVVVQDRCLGLGIALGVICWC